MRLRTRKGACRRAAAVVELAIISPLLVFLFLITIDYCRVFYFSVIVANCARNGAVYGSDPVKNEQYSSYTSVTEAALADAKDLTPQPTVQTAYGADYVEVTVMYPFKTFTSFPGIPTAVDLKRTVRMQIAPRIPNI